jgi:ketosteroid isomerase-like protein
MATIDSMRALYERSVATGDFERMGTLLAEGAVMVGPGGPHWDSLRAASDLPWPPGATLEISPIEVRVLSDEWAYEFGTSTATYTPTGASELRTLRDTYLVLFRKTADGWKLYREVASPDLPTSTTPDQ